MKTISYLKGRKAFWCLIFLSAPCLHPPAGASGLASQTYFQQANTISGTVSDASGTLPGVSVSVKAKPGATLSDSKGAYQIKAAIGETLVFSFLGYAAQEIKITGTGRLDIVLAGDIHPGKLQPKYCILPSKSYPRSYRKVPKRSKWQV